MKYLIIFLLVLVGGFSFVVLKPEITSKNNIYSASENKSKLIFTTASDLSGNEYSNILKSSDYMELPEKFNISGKSTAKIEYSNNFIIYLDRLNKNVASINRSNNTFKDYNLDDIIGKESMFIDLFVDESAEKLYIVGYNTLNDNYTMYRTTLSLDKTQLIDKIGDFSISFLRFGVIDGGKKFIFFAPMESLYDNESILITDSEFNVLHKTIKLPNIVKSQNLLISESVKFVGSKVYYNPVLTDDIYEIDINGKMTKIFNGYIDGDEMKSLKEIEKTKPLAANDVNFYTNSTKIHNFYVTKDYIYIIKNQIGSFLTIYERKTGRSVMVKLAIKLTNLDAPFDLVFDNFNTIHDNLLITFLSGNQTKETIDNYKSFPKNDVDNIYQALKKSYSKNVYHIYSYNFDQLYLFAEKTNKKSNGKLDIDGFSVFPSLATDKIRISTNNDHSYKFYQIISNTGKTVVSNKLESSVSENINEIDVSTIPSGQYYIQLISGNNKSKPKVFIKY
jgi:hypothetical protein